MISIPCRGVLFDMDGVLVDSTPTVARVWSGWAREHGFEPEAVVKQAHGRPSIATIRELLPHADHHAEDREVERRELEDVEDVVALPGAGEILRMLSANRYAIVTSATRRLAEVRLRAAGLPIPAHLVTASDVKRGKPNPDPYLMGAESLRLPPPNCIVVEDAPSGVRAGKAAGARVIAVRTTTSDAELSQAGADWIIADLSFLRAELSQADGEIALVLNQGQ
jgi:sugar-phosphatase